MYVYLLSEKCRYSNRRTIGYKNRPFYYSSKQIFQPLVTTYEARISAGLFVSALPLSKTSFMTQSATELPSERESA
jgi:hypothetical protein